MHRVNAAAILTAAAMAFVLMLAPAQAQFSLGGGSGEGGTKTRYTEEEKRREAANEKAYRDTVKATKGATNESYDPWRNIRPETTPEKKR